MFLSRQRYSISLPVTLWFVFVYQCKRHAMLNQANSDSQSWFRLIELLLRGWALNYLLVIDIKLQLNAISVFSGLCLSLSLLCLPLLSFPSAFFPSLCLSHTLTWLHTNESLHSEVRGGGSHWFRGCSNIVKSCFQCCWIVLHYKEMCF